MATINDVYNEIDRIEAAKEAIENAVEERGIEVPAGSLLGDIPPLIRQIPGPVQADWNEDDPNAPDFIKNKPTIPSAPGTLDTNNEESQQVSESEDLSGNIKLHKISKTGNYSDLLDKPTIPAAQVQSDWEQSNSEAKDFIKNKPTIPAAQVQSDWDEADSQKPEYIKNKPTIPAAQIQSDWEQSNSEAKDFIKNKPTIPAAQVQSDWNEQDSDKIEFIKNKPTIPTVPQISTDVEAERLVTDKTVCPKAVYDSVHPQLQSSQPSSGLLPNVLYNLGILSGNGSISFAAPVDVNVENEYKFTFNTSSTPPTIYWPNTIIGWAGNCLDSNNQPDIKGGKHYEISVVGGYAIIVEI